MEGIWRVQVADANANASKSVQHLAYDPCSKSLLGTTNVRWVDWMVDFHRNLLAGNTGRKMVGAVGIGLLLVALSGLSVWLLANPRWRTALRINKNVSFRRLVFDVHCSAGLKAMFLILLQSGTGIWLAYPKTLGAAVNWFGPSRANPKALRTKVNAKSNGGQITVSDFLRAASAALPDGRVSEIRLPDADGKSVQVRMWRAGDVRATGNNTITLNPSTAAVVSVAKFADQPAARKLVESVTPIHFGEWGGFGYRVLLSAVGCVPPVLLASGFLIWWLPKRARARRAAVLPSEQVSVTSLTA